MTHDVDEMPKVGSKTSTAGSFFDTSTNSWVIILMSHTMCVYSRELDSRTTVFYDGTTHVVAVTIKGINRQ